MNSIAHIEINVKDLEASSAFWSKFLAHLEWTQFEVGHPAVKGFRAPDGTNVFLVQTEGKFIDSGYHRKHIGMNHVALRLDSVEKVDAFATFLKENQISILYGDGPKDYSSEYGKERYYAVFLEDPDRIKIEVVYCK